MFSDLIQNCVRPNMNNLILYTSFCIAIPQTLFALYDPTPFPEIVAETEAIVAGEIVELDRDTYQFKVTDALVGPIKTGDLIRVQRFHDWACAWRWQEYKVGQPLLLFLNQSEKETWQFPGGGGEGECALIEGEVYAHSAAPGREIRVPDRHGGFTLFQAIPYAKLRPAIIDFRNQFQFTISRQPRRHIRDKTIRVPFERISSITEPKPDFRPRRPETEFEDRSPMHRYFANFVASEREKMSAFPPE